jgi:hypothetical protein
LRLSGTPPSVGRICVDVQKKNRVCEVAHAICVGHTLYVYTISDYGHPERIGGPAPKSFDVAILFSGAIAASGLYTFTDVYAALIYTLQYKAFFRLESMHFPGSCGFPP